MYIPDPSLLEPTLYDPVTERDACGVGFVADIEGRRANTILRHALTVLVNLRHRGACGCEPNTGDGAGVLFQTPHAFLAAAAAEQGIALPRPWHYGVGMVFLPVDPEQRRACEAVLEETVREMGQSVLGWRTVPTHDASLGATARSAEPVVRQVFVGRNDAIAGDMAFERKLYVIRQVAEHTVRAAALPGGESFYIASLSARTILYKGMLTSEQLQEFYPELLDPRMETALALVHSRFSTNTFPCWARSQPFRFMLHNGEINTIRGNLNWMNAREKMFAWGRPGRSCSGTTCPALLPVIDAEGSDSAMFDNALELLVLGGRSLAHAIMMMIPEPWENNPQMTDERRGVLRISQLPDGAVGRSGLGPVHRRGVGRRGARPQRAAALTLLSDPRQPSRPRVRGGSAGHPRRRRDAEGTAPAGQDASRRHRGASPPARRRDQGGGGAGAPIPPMARQPDGGPGRPASAAPGRRRPRRRRFCSASRHSATPSKN